MRVLVVEDEPKVAGLLVKALEEEGYAVDSAQDGEAGLGLALANDYDAIVLDWLLPRRDGLAVCKGIRDAGRRVPVLMLTAKDSIDDRIAGLDAGADDYMVKPFALGEMLARVRALLRRANKEAPVITFEDLSLDPATRLAHRGKREIFLTAKEYQLLEYLMRNPGQTLSRAQIAENVWDLTFDTGTNVVDVYINYIRNKIDKPADQKLIHTIRGVGYKMDTAHDPIV